MPHILQNDKLKVRVDFPNENYRFSRFDQTGKLTEVSYQNIPLSVSERTETTDEHLFGKGFYNEFGIDTALGFEEAEIGGWFHKIGVGLLKKDSDRYDFARSYTIKPASFKISLTSNSVSTSCIPQELNGYSYELKKKIRLLENGFSIDYTLKNSGEKDIKTDEYVHNFIAVNKEKIGDNYQLKFPFQLYPEQFKKVVNPEQKIVFEKHQINFNGTPKYPFFFSGLSADKMVPAHWRLTNRKKGIHISETGSFKTNKINLWGWEHVVSPELFMKIFLKPGQSAHWSRTYQINVFKA